MARTNRRTNRTRQDKVVEGSFNSRKQKFTPVEEVVETQHYAQQALPQFTAANERQRAALRHLNADTPFVFLRGASGAGKSMIAAYRAAKLLKEKRVDQIYLIRPAVLCGNTIGLIPGEISSKMSPFFMQTIAHLEYFMGKGFTKYCLDKEIIKYIPYEYIRGMSIEHVVCICEEMQNLTHAEFETMLTRRGKGSQIIFTGDERQKDIKGVSGLTSTIDMIEKAVEQEYNFLDDDDLDCLANDIAIVTFLPEDNMRSGVTKALSKLYHYL